MDYDTAVKRLGSFGKYQKRLLFIMFLPVMFNSFGTPVTVFLIGDQLHRCKLHQLKNDTYEVQGSYHQQQINDSIPVDSNGNYKACVILVNGTEEKCTEWVYDTSVFIRTVNGQFDLVCDNALQKSHAITAYFIGYVGAALTMIPLGDMSHDDFYYKRALFYGIVPFVPITAMGTYLSFTISRIGRRMVVCLMRTLSLFVNLALPFSPDVITFTVLRFLDGYTGSAFYQASFIIGMELVRPPHRLIAGTLILLVYCLGEFILLILAYFIRDWRWLQLTLAVPMIYGIMLWWPRIYPESPRWLISRGRTEEALVILRRAAKVNKVKLPDEIKLTKETDKGLCVILKELFHSRKLILRWFIVITSWLSVTFIYYGLTINVGQLGGNLYVNFFIAVLVEAIGYSFCFVLDHTGRKPYHLTFMYAAGAACFASIFPLMFGSKSLNWLVILLCMIGKLAISAAFGEIFIYTGELFPTVVRSIILASCNLGARLGAAVAPYLYKLADGDFGDVLPLIMYSVLVTIAATLSIALPETRRRKLLERVKDVDKADSETKKSTFKVSSDCSEDSEDDTESSPL